MIVKLNFLQSSVSHDLSEIIRICWFAAQITMLKKIVLLTIFVESTFNFFQFFLWKEGLKEQHLFEIFSNSKCL